MTPRNVVFASVSSGSALLMALVYFVAARYLGTAGFGLFNYALSLAMIAEALIDMGLHQLTIREVAQSPDARFALLRQQAGLKLVTGLAVIAVGIAGSAVVTPDPTSLTVVTLMLVSALLRSWFLSVRGGLIGLEAFGTDAALVAGDRILLTLAGTAALVAGVDVVGLAVVFLATRVVTVVVAVVATRRALGRPAWRFEPAAWSALQRRALPLGAFAMALTAYNYIDAIMLTAMTSEVQTGIYSAAYRLYEGTTYAAAVLWSVLAPRLSALWTSDRHAHARLTRRGLLAGLAVSAPIAVALWIGAGTWIAWTSGAAYGESLPTLRVLAFGLPLIFATWVLHAVAMSASHDRVLLRSTLIGLLVNVALNLWLIPRFGHTGAALATVLGEALTIGLLVGGLWRVLSGRLEATA